MSAAPRALPVTGLSRDAATTVSLVFLCNCVNALSVGGIALFLPLIRGDLNISFTQAGMLSVAATATYALGQIPAGFLTDRFGLLYRRHRFDRVHVAIRHGGQL